MDNEGLHQPALTSLVWEETHRLPGSGTGDINSAVNRTTDPRGHSSIWGPGHEKSTQWWHLPPLLSNPGPRKTAVWKPQDFFPPQYYLTIKLDAHKLTSGWKWVTKLLPTMPSPASWHRLETTNAALQTSEILTCLTVERTPTSAPPDCQNRP